MRIFFASTESWLAYDGVLKHLDSPNLLVSYYYLRKRKKPRLLSFLKEIRKKGEKLFLDSWAHTFLAAHDLKEHFVSASEETKKALSGQNAIDYGNAYIDRLEEYHHYFDKVAELDIWQVPGVGYDKIKERRKEICIRIPTMKDRLVVVSHYVYFQKEFWDRSIEWQNMLDNWKSLAIWDGPPEGVLNKHFKMRSKTGNNNEIHWFAETKMWKMEKYPYYSVDSSSRQCGSRFWSSFYFDKKQKKIKTLAKLSSRTKAQRKENYKMFVKKVLPHLPPKARKWDWTKALFYKGGPTRDYLSCIAFQEAEKYLNKVWTARWIKFKS